MQQQRIDQNDTDFVVPFRYKRVGITDAVVLDLTAENIRDFVMWANDFGGTGFAALAFLTPHVKDLFTPGIAQPREQDPQRLKQLNEEHEDVKQVTITI